MTYDRNAYVSFTGRIVNSTFSIRPTHARFEIEDVTDIQMSGGVEEIVTPTMIVYWGDLSNFNPLMVYTIRINGATVSVFREKIQYNVQKDNLEITDRHLQQGTTEATAPTFHDAVNTGLCLVFAVEEPQTLIHFNSMMRKSKLANFAELVAMYPITHAALSMTKQPLLVHLLKHPYHLATYCFLAFHKINVPFEDTPAKTIQLARMILENPYDLLGGSWYHEYLDYEDFTYDRLHDLALESLGVRVMKEPLLIQSRTVAAIMQILRDEEMQKGNTWISLRQVKNLLCQKLKQTLPIIEDGLSASQELYTQMVVPFIVGQKGNTGSPRDDDQQVRLQHPNTKVQEDFILAFIGYTRQRKEIPINEPLLRKVLDQVYGAHGTRDEYQLSAIRLAISRHVSCISGPPGAGNVFVYLLGFMTLMGNKVKPLW